jgi:hypothetical protein
LQLTVVPHAKQVDTFQYSCLTVKDMSVNTYTDFVTVFYRDSQNASANMLTCPSAQFLVINAVRARRGRVNPERDLAFFL